MKLYICLRHYTMILITHTLNIDKRKCHNYYTKTEHTEKFLPPDGTYRSVALTTSSRNFLRDFVKDLCTGFCGIQSRYYYLKKKRISKCFLIRFYYVHYHGRKKTVFSVRYRSLAKTNHRTPNTRLLLYTEELISPVCHFPSSG